MAEVVREEVRAVRAQLADAARPAGLGFVLLAAAGGGAVALSDRETRYARVGSAVR
ncbi:hypothetical protein JNW88_14535 [Micromonospora sp. ATA32]|nr:hypothetical protein [Micromonospora sp. ATA32]